MKSEIPIEQTIDSFLSCCDNQKFKTILADPPWQFKNRTGKVAPEHKRLNRYPTMTLEDIMKAGNLSPEELGRIKEELKNS